MADRQTHRAQHVGLPPRVFLYTLDQIALMLSVSQQQVELGYIFFEGRTDGIPQRDEMIARNIAPRDAKPEWRVAENDFVRWLKLKGFRFHESGWATR